MSKFGNAARDGLLPADLEKVLLEVGAERYHNRHPYHHQMVNGTLTKGQMQAWALNRYCYQSVIPRKDAMIPDVGNSARVSARTQTTLLVAETEDERSSVVPSVAFCAHGSDVPSLRSSGSRAGTSNVST